MLDIKVIRENLDWSKKKLATRGIKPEELDELVEIDTKRRKDLTKSEQLKAKRNDVSKQIAEKKRNKEDASDAIAAMREVGKEIKDLDKEVAELLKSKTTSCLDCLTSQLIQTQLVRTIATTKKFVSGTQLLNLTLSQRLTGILVLTLAS